jgi:GT2 family glycosyltransferase
VFEWDHPFLSGQVLHGAGPSGARTVYGVCPAPCESLDGLFLAMDLQEVRRVGAQFDERFDFHFYDLDFCRTCRSLGLQLGTWPIVLTHQSAGNFGGENWKSMSHRYFSKWAK